VGPPEDYDNWAAQSNSGWSYRDIAPLIEETECAAPPIAYHGRNGLLPTRVYADTELSAWHQRFLQAAGQLGFPRLADLSAPDPVEGIAPGQVNVVDGARWNAAFAFLDPVRASPRLTILSESLADRLVIEDGRATGLLCRRPDGPLELRARVFVLAGGAYGSPTLLLRSGVGPAADLTALGIRPALDRPGVGRNLHDHPALTYS
jgi:choline dehydrogenase